MKPEVQTRENLLKAAKEEFMEKGYAAASLRNICKKAEVTTGALYFFFKDKEDLYGSLVREPLERIYTLMREHYDSELKDIRAEIVSNDMDEDKKVAFMVVDCMYQYYDEFVLLIMKSQGSRYENCTDELVAITEKHCRVLADWISETYHVKYIDDYTIHWTAHLQIFSFIQLIEHGLSREDALKQMDTIIEFLTNGWFGMYQRIP
jgi:AcrR family transcriptional regulator